MRTRFHSIGMPAVMFAFCSLTLCALSTQLYAQTPSSCKKTFVYSTKDTGDQVEGPACVAVEFNALRYAAQLGRTVTISQGPGLPAALTPPAANAPQANIQNAPVALIVADTLDRIHTEFEAAWNTFYTANDIGNKASQAMVGQAIAQLKVLVAASDGAFAVGGAQAVLNTAPAAPLQALLSTALTQR